MARVGACQQLPETKGRILRDPHQRDSGNRRRALIDTGYVGMYRKASDAAVSRTVSDKLGMYVGEQRDWPCYAVCCVSKSPAGGLNPKSCACQKHEVAIPGKAAGASMIEVSLDRRL